MAIFTEHHTLLDFDFDELSRVFSAFAKSDTKGFGLWIQMVKIKSGWICFGTANTALGLGLGYHRLHSGSISEPVGRSDGAMESVSYTLLTDFLMVSSGRSSPFGMQLRIRLLPEIPSPLGCFLLFGVFVRHVEP